MKNVLITLVSIFLLCSMLFAGCGRADNSPTQAAPSASPAGTASTSPEATAKAEKTPGSTPGRAIKEDHPEVIKIKALLDEWYKCADTLGYKENTVPDFQKYYYDQHYELREIRYNSTLQTYREHHVVQEGLGLAKIENLVIAQDYSECSADIVSAIRFLEADEEFLNNESVELNKTYYYREFLLLTYKNDRWYILTGALEADARLYDALPEERD